jgi:chromosome segregation ATPase
MNQAEAERQAKLGKANEAVEKSKQELTDLKQKIESKEAADILARTAEKARLDKQLEEANKLIMMLKRENLRIRKEEEKYRSRRDEEAGLNDKLEGSHRDYSEGVDFAEELAIKEKSNYGTLMDDYESSKALNREMKNKFRSQQNQYLEEAGARLELQKCLQKIINIMNASKNKPNDVVIDVNAIVKNVETTAKGEMAELEAQFGSCADYSETDFE